MLTLSVSGWWLLLVGAGAITGAAWSYARTQPALPPAWRWGLGTLRAATLFLVALLLLEPFWTRERTTTYPPQLGVLVDNSLSMQHTGIDTSSTSVSAQMDALFDSWIGTLEAAPRIYPFDASLRLDAPRTYDGTSTNLTAALRDARQQYEPYTDTPLSALALVSDGQHNSGPFPLQQAEDAGVPIYPVVVGDTLPQRDVQVRRVRTNERGYVDTPHPVEARIRSIEAAGESVTVSLLGEDGTTLDQTTLSLPEGTADQPVSLSYTPTSAGTRTLTVRVSDLPGQATDATNTQSTTVRIDDRARTAWIVAGSAFPDVGALRRILASNPEWDVSATVLGPQGELLTPLSDAETAPDVLLLAGLPTANTPQRILDRLSDWIDTQPLLVFAGPQVDADRLDALAGERLPASLSAASDQEARVVPHDQAARHPVWTGLDNASAWAQLPPVLIRPSTDARPDAQVLATTERGMPFLHTLQRNQQRSALVTGYRTWRWRTLPPARSTAATLWPTLVTNLARWASTDLDTPVRIRPDAPVFAGTEPVTFSGRVFDGRGEPVSEAAVALTVTNDAGEELPYTMTHAGGGQYRGDAGALPAGSYTYTATATRNGTTLGTDAGSFDVDTPNVERQATRTNLQLMTQLAARTGGEVLFLDEADALPERLQSHPNFTPTDRSERSSAALAHAWPFLVLLIGLLSAEWFLRKRQGLA
ncbi:hypothetical protein CRI93_07610 [Longimonas halophila]|uniref:VWFA domain-containing protein n=1 Tax=Longimonas halophila TaxID=1469170 RepID=A0A2H3P5E5_9BACT|nr:hypothetical protein [Longimonas halophila]PEN06998.1 hypothetical protein CRI93_07610 [Longimonas halophila]